MVHKLDPRQVVTFEELLRSLMYEMEAARRVLVRKGLLSNEEVLEEIKAVLRPRRRQNFLKHQRLCRRWAMDYRYPGLSISFTPKGGLSIPHRARGVKGP
ncbi:MAG: hypothetical protein ACE5FB_04520 [Candidatus Binatia bacterium]